jgi:hypothetical protein
MSLSVERMMYKCRLNSVMGIFSINYSTNSKQLVLLENLLSPQPDKKFATFYGNQNFITEFTRVGHLSLSYARLK